ncbi:MAG: DUF2325 domain-containing protein [Burkholderiaceae bacterium]|nr:DUF2325 domain-containing protein [Burkholderiaceae bacterium]
MKALLVGADRLGNIPQVLTEYGISIMRHVSGRDPSAQRGERTMPAGAEMLILFTDFLGHNVMRGYRDAARKQGVPVLACRRSTCSLRGALEACTHCRYRLETEEHAAAGRPHASQAHDSRAVLASASGQ